MARYEDITKTAGKTPLVKINRLSKGLGAEIYAKLESFNPLSSIKDRIGTAMIEEAEQQGKLRKGSVIIEPTSGNTGIALAFAAATKGYRLILTMPETMSTERRRLLKMLGAEIVLTEGSKGLRGAVEKAGELAAQTPNSFMAGQFDNPVNPQVHRRTTAVELWDDMGGRIDAFVCGVGTGGTITGVGGFLKQKSRAIMVIAVEPEGSPVLSGGEPGPHRIQGIGAGFIPKVLDRSLIDEIVKVSDDNAEKTARELAKKEGILAGISSGAAMWAALETAKSPSFNKKKIAVILPDTGERYLSTRLFGEELE